MYILLLAPRPAGKARATSIPAATAAVCKERATQPAGLRAAARRARRRAGICGVAAPRRCHHIGCVAAPCICPPGARAKMHALFSDGPLASLTSTTCYGTRIFTDSNTVQPARNQTKPKSFAFLRVLRAFAVKSSPEFTAKTRSARREQECRQWLIEDGSLKTLQVRVASTSRLCVHVHRRLRRQGRERLCE